MARPSAPDFQQILRAHWPDLAGTPVEPITGGLSGAPVWRVDRRWCLKAHPSDRINARTYSATVHAWARQAHHLPLPQAMPSRSGGTCIDHDGWVWELIDWLPGQANFRDDPNDRRLDAVCDVLADLHRSWSTLGTMSPTIPAVERRLKSFAEWRGLIKQGWRPVFTNPLDPYRAEAELLWQRLPARIDRELPELLRWRDRRTAVHPCLCDVWHDHLLFEGDRVTGVIDLSAAKIDHPAVDLARALGSLIPNDPLRCSRALDRYQTRHHLPDPELVPLLTRTGHLVAATRWLRWLYHDHRRFDSPPVVLTRLRELVAVGVDLAPN